VVVLAVTDLSGDVVGVDKRETLNPNVGFTPRLKLWVFASKFL